MVHALPFEVHAPAVRTFSATCRADSRRLYGRRHFDCGLRNPYSGRKLPPCSCLQFSQIQRSMDSKAGKSWPAEVSSMRFRINLTGPRSHFSHRALAVSPGFITSSFLRGAVLQDVPLRFGTCCLESAPMRDPLRQTDHDTLLRAIVAPLQHCEPAGLPLHNRGAPPCQHVMSSSGSRMNGDVCCVSEASSRIFACTTVCASSLNSSSPQGWTRGSRPTPGKLRWHRPSRSTLPVRLLARAERHRTIPSRRCSHRERIRPRLAPMNVGRRRSGPGQPANLSLDTQTTEAMAALTERLRVLSPRRDTISIRAIPPAKRRRKRTAPRR